MKNILLVIDMQKGFARYPQTIRLTEKIKELLDSNAFDKVIATRFLNDDNSIYERLFNWKRLKSDEDKELANGYINHIDFITDKYIYNCVNPSFIQRLCQINDGEYPDKVFICGADTDCCVLTIATSLFENNIRPIVLTNYVDSNGGPESHEAGLKCLTRLVGPEQLVNKKIDKKEDLSSI